MSSEEPEYGEARRIDRDGSGAPVGSVLSVILAVAAVGIGYFVLRQIDDDDGATAAPEQEQVGRDTDETEPTTGGSGATTTVPPAAEPAFEGATVVVANANNQGGSASVMSDKLADAGFTMGEPADDTSDEPVRRTRVLFTPSDQASRAVAETVARALGGVRVARLPNEIPVVGGEIDGTVLVMLGTDKVDAELEQL